MVIGDDLDDPNYKLLDENILSCMDVRLDPEIAAFFTPAFNYPEVTTGTEEQKVWWRKFREASSNRKTPDLIQEVIDNWDNLIDRLPMLTNRYSLEVFRPYLHNVGEARNDFSYINFRQDRMNISSSYWFHNPGIMRDKYYTITTYAFVQKLVQLNEIFKRSAEDCHAEGFVLAIDKLLEFTNTT